ncbi:MAG: hypothetical protein GPJ52_00670 [Candidatus Heimdallarchaeota archaeon]|nr:hypothetical protein [Candidatus Heimdallarchaeota archaeon]
MIGGFEENSIDKTIKFVVREELSFKDLLKLVSNLGVKIIYISPTSKFNYIETSFLNAAGNKHWYDDIDEWPDEETDSVETTDKNDLQIMAINKKINDIITNNLGREEEKEGSEDAVIYSIYFYLNGIIHFHTILNNELLLEIDKRIMNDILQLEDLVSKRDELEIKLNENEKNTKQQRRIELAKELIDDPIFAKLKNNRMRLNYIAQKYNLPHFQLQPVLDEVQLLSIKRQNL